jgi:hypothetical protein
MKIRMTEMNTYPQFFFNKTTFKVRIGHTSFQLVYGLHMLLPIKYLIPSRPGNFFDPTLVRVLIS